MTELLERALMAVRQLPDDEQNAIAEVMLTLAGLGDDGEIDPDELQDVMEALAEIERGEIDPSRIISHTVRLDDAPRMYEAFQEKRDDCLKVVLKP